MSSNGFISCCQAPGEWATTQWKSLASTNDCCEFTWRFVTLPFLAIASIFCYLIYLFALVLNLSTCSETEKPASPPPPSGPNGDATIDIPPSPKNGAPPPMPALPPVIPSAAEIDAQVKARGILPPLPTFTEEAQRAFLDASLRALYPPPPPPPAEVAFEDHETIAAMRALAPPPRLLPPPPPRPPAPVISARVGLEIQRMRSASLNAPPPPPRAEPVRVEPMPSAAPVSAVVIAKTVATTNGPTPSAAPPPPMGSAPKANGSAVNGAAAAAVQVVSTIPVLSAADAKIIGGILKDTQEYSTFGLIGIKDDLTARGKLVKHVNPFTFFGYVFRHRLEAVRGIRGDGNTYKWAGAMGNDGFLVQTCFRFVTFDLQGPTLRAQLNEFATLHGFDLEALKRLVPSGPVYDKLLADLRPLDPDSAKALPFYRAASKAWGPFMEYLVTQYKPANAAAAKK